MKKHPPGLSILVVILCACSSTPQRPSAGDVDRCAQSLSEDLAKALSASALEAPLGEPLNVAVGSFRSLGKPSRRGDELRGMLQAKIGRLLPPPCQLVTPERVREILGALKLTASDLSRPRGGAFGKLEGVDLLVVGDLFVFESGTRVEARAIDVRTGVEKAAASGDFPWTSSSAEDLEGPLRVEFYVALERMGPTGTYEEVLLQDGASVRSGDRFQASVKASRDSWAYLFLVDSQGSVNPLVPGHAAKAKEHQLHANVDTRFPGPRATWEFDQVTGKETLILVVSLEPLEDVEALLESLASLAAEERKVAGKTLAGKVEALREKGIVGVSVKVEREVQDLQGRTVRRSVELLEERGEGLLVRALSLDHR